MKTPTPDEMEFAADWLERNEGEPNERDPLARVAAWLKLRAASSRETDAIKSVAKACKVSPKAVRAKLATKRQIETVEQDPYLALIDRRRDEMRS